MARWLRYPVDGIDCIAPASFTHHIRRMYPSGSRQTRELAEGQKSATVKHILHPTTPLRQPRELAEWVEFLEKYAHFDDLQAALAEGVGASKWRPSGLGRRRRSVGGRNSGHGTGGTATEPGIDPVGQKTVPDTHAFDTQRL
jgi:hypothetical protein